MQEPQTLLKKYADEGEPVTFVKEKRKIQTMGVNLLADKLHKGAPADLLQRTLIRHDPDKLGNTIMQLL